MLELYHGEPNGLYLKPLIALKEKNIGFVSRYFDPLSFEQHGELFPRNVEANLQLEREGPLLVHHGEVITSSYFMLEYIAEAFPGVDLLPGDAYCHYRSRAWGQFLGLGLGPAVSALGCAKYLSPVLSQRDQGELRARLARIEPIERRAAWLATLDGGYSEGALAAARERLKMPVTRVENTLAASPWLAGPDYSIADIDAFAMLASLPDLAPEVVNARETPHVVRFLERMGDRPAVRAARALARTARPHEAFVPGPEPSRWG